MVGRQLLNPRGGSIAEDEVSSLIRRVAFLNRPLAPDDIGADFVCAVAHRRLGGTNPQRQVPMLYAGNWFLLSVKKGSATVGLERSSGHFDWFKNLEVPFLIAQVEPDVSLRVTIYHTLQHVAVIRKLPELVESVEFRCETSPKYKPRNYQIDRSDIVEIEGDKAIAWLGPPLLDLTRPQLVDGDVASSAVRLLQAVCDSHLKVRSLALEGMESGIFWQTNESIDWAVKSMNLQAVARSSHDTLQEIEDILDTQTAGSLPRSVWESSKPFFRFFSALRHAKPGEQISHEDVFTSAGDRFLRIKPSS